MAMAIEVQAGHAQPADLDDLPQERGGGERAGGGAEDDDGEVLQEDGDGERGQEHRHLVRAPDGAVCHPFHHQAARGARRDADRRRDPEGQAQEEQQQGDVASHHDQVPVGEVDQAQDAEDHGQADGHEGVEAADADRVDELLEEELETRHAPRPLGGAAEVCALDVGVGAQLGARPAQHHAPGLQDVPPVGNRQGLPHVLLHQEDGDPAGVQLPDQP